MMTPVMPDSFLHEVKDALENLYDFAFLNRHPLSATSPVTHGAEADGHRLRRELVEAIETLHPSASSGSGGRVYHLLNLHYVAGMTIPEAAANLGVSPRQAYRDLRQGHESVSYLLWYRRQSTTETTAPTAEASPDHAPERAAPTDISAIVETAIKAVSRLAERTGVALSVVLPDTPLVIATDQAVAQQVCIHVISQTIQASQPRPLAITLSASDDASRLDLDYSPRDPTVGVPIDAVVQGFIERLHFQVTQPPIVAFAAEPAGTVRLSLILARRRPTLLVIDDHIGLSDLLQRYLTGRALEVTAAADALTGLQLAQELQPDAVIVDLMMPGMDGWELLQRLRTTPTTAHLPVIICSVINDPELAYSLGASFFLSKPVTRESLLTALETIGL